MGWSMREGCDIVPAVWLGGRLRRGCMLAPVDHEHLRPVLGSRQRPVLGLAEVGGICVRRFRFGTMGMSIEVGPYARVFR